ncbi:AzlC family ABC transporter permease [Haladaptatus halobius]|uniref:AzlC family ABC transporter permease n=1 Tax=Haladaptatus halobius TaxID=2884875 RepID=UPI001D09CD41|nr:AzlC family ABC transporter permease [Haladaptatus halobius]
MTAQKDALAGARAMIPILLGTVPWALITGVAAVNAGLSPIQAVAMSAILFSGTAQLVAIDLIGRTAPVAVIVVTAIVVLLRYPMYSASIAPYFRRFNPLWKGICAYVLSDAGYAISLSEYRATSSQERDRKWFYLGGSATLWATWQVGTVVGVVVGAQIPDSLSLEFVIPLTFMALLFPLLEDQPTELTAIVAGSIGVVTGVIPFNLGLVIAALAGIAAGTLVEHRRGVFPTTSEREAELASETDYVNEEETA